MKNTDKRIAVFITLKLIEILAIALIIGAIIYVPYYIGIFGAETPYCQRLNEIDGANINPFCSELDDWTFVIWLTGLIYIFTVITIFIFFFCVIIPFIKYNWKKAGEIVK